MAGPVIQTPRGMVTQGPNGTARLTWNPDFVDRWGGRYKLSQKYVDSEVLRLSEPYTPLLTSMLIKSGTLGTVIGSGLVTWIAPYARAQYYSRRQPGSATGPMRGPFWFERMKSVKKDQITAGARARAGR